MPTKKTSNSDKIVAGAAGVAALAAAAAGAYYFLGKDGAKHRKAAKAMAETAKKQVMHQLAKMEKTGQAQYQKAVTEVLKNYKNLKSANPEQIALVKTELTNYWKQASKVLEKISKKPEVKKVVKKVLKKK